MICGGGCIAVKRAVRFTKTVLSLRPGSNETRTSAISRGAPVAGRPTTLRTVEERTCGEPVSTCAVATKQQQNLEWGAAAFPTDRESGLPPITLCTMICGGGCIAVKRAVRFTKTVLS